MLGRYFLSFRGNVLLILARSISEALEPWSRINNRSVPIQEFQASFIDPPSDSNFLLLTGRTITKDDLKQFQKEKTNPQSAVKITRAESPKLKEIIVEKKPEKVAALEEYFF